MNNYRFVGVNTKIGDREFTTFGSVASFTDDQFKEVARGGAAFITEDEFEALGISEEELEKYTSINYFGAIPEDLRERFEKGRDIYRSFVLSLAADSK